MYYYIPESMVTKQNKKKSMSQSTTTTRKKTITFDLDWTLTYGENHLFPKLKDDIHLMPRRKSKLTYLADHGWQFVIFTNQFCRGKKDLKSKLDRIAHFIENFDWDVAVFIATKKDSFRKPAPGMWNFAKDLLQQCEFRMFVGDAAGRVQDFSDSDKQFAENASIKFLEPEQVFKPRLPMIPKINGIKNMVLFVGMPGCGKSTFHTEHLSNYTRINQDTLKTATKVKAATIDAIEEGSNICIDNTNNSLKKRRVYYDLAKKHGYNVFTIYFIRDGRGWNNLRDKPVPDIAYHMYFKYLDPPNNHNTPGTLFKIT